MAEKKAPKSISKGDIESHTPSKSSISLRGKEFVGKVTSAKMSKTVTVSWEWRRYVPKYERYEKKRSKVKAHNTINAKEGDIVRIRETRPLSKTKHFVVVEILKGDNT